MHDSSRTHRTHTHPATMAALAARDQLHQRIPFEPVARINYLSQGRLLIVGEGERVRQALQALQGALSAAVFWTGKSSAPTIAGVEVKQGEMVAVEGYLGAFQLLWKDTTAAPTQVAEFDLILDLQLTPLFKMPQPPQGYFHAADSDGFVKACVELPEMIGEFEKPKYFAYKESICAHSRSQQQGCNKCIDVCSTRAISSAGDLVAVDPHLCMGCGACATVCPSGAMSYQYPRVADRGAEFRAMLGAYRSADAKADAPIFMFHHLDDAKLQQLLLPDNILPVAVWHVASIGLDVLLGALAYGAAGVVVLAKGDEAPDYALASQREMATGELILNALGYTGKHFAWSEVAGQNLSAVSGLIDPAVANHALVPPATFHLSNDKRATLEFAIEHFAKYAVAKPMEIALSKGSLYGGITVNKETCTMCLACAGACPESALMDGGELPQLKFLERNCVQCGLCANTCPEQAITLVPRLLMSDSRKKEVVLNETEPFDCISCGKPLGTKMLIDKMLGKLAGHSMFQSEGSLKRLQMCADCRVVDMMANKNEISILTGRPIE